MKKTKRWRMIAGILLLLGIGVLTGILIGMPIGEKRGRREAEEVFRQQEQVEYETADEEHQTGKATGTVNPASVPEPTEEVMPTASVQPTAAPTEGVISTDEVRPNETPEVTAMPEVTVTPKATAVPVVTSIPTTTPKPTGIPKAEGENGYYGRLHVEGTYLADKEDNIVQLRGISTHGIGWFPQYVNETAIRQFNEEWGCNVLRLAMYTAEGAGYCTNGTAQKERLKEIIHTGVTAVIKQDMYVIIDWHVLQDRDPNVYKDEAKIFFAEMAKKYGDDPHVIYEICNEPNSGVTWSQIKTYAMEVIPVIREHAPNAIIIVGTPTWSQDVDVAADDPITEYDNIMYALHFYAETHQESLRNKCKIAVAKGLPIFVTEYGICDASGNGVINEKQANIWIDMLDGYGISHVAWNLSNKNESSSMIAAGCSKVNGFTQNDLSAGGKWFVDMLQRAGVGIGSALSGTTEAGQKEDSGSSGSSSGDGGGNAQTGIDAAYITEILAAGDGLSYSVSNSWNTENGAGVQLSLTVKNDSTKELTDWERKLTVKEGVSVEVAQNWNSTVTRDGNTIIVKPAEYNKVIAAGGSVGDIGLILNIPE